MKSVRTSLAVFFLSSAILTACQKGVSDVNVRNVNQPHRATIFLTDDQVPLFDSVFIDLQKLEVKVEDEILGTESWVTLNIRPGVYNILRLRNGIDTLFATGTLPNADIRKLRLTLGTRNSITIGSQSLPLRIHDNEMQVVVNIEAGDFEIVGSDQVLFWMDFDLAGSIRVDNSGPGKNNGFELKPHIKIFTKSKSGRIEGKIFPEEAHAMVMAIHGADTTMAIPDDDDGEFKIAGLHEGVYSVFVHGQNGYNDVAIDNIRVANGEDTHIPAITLHK